MAEIIKGIPVTAKGWYMFDDMEGAEAAARDIAQTLSDLINEKFKIEFLINRDNNQECALAFAAVFNRTMEKMQSYSDFGTLDGESMTVLSNVTRRVFFGNQF
jgi:hypothetical protein